ncbi:sec-independent protein translocase protein TatA [Actinocorallia herbida]|uniref:Sec-independent protein translocase protein TatA n=1 Tax=Actinocorallia herbida TaxID=58109 RepID=A0A3N1D4G9_9ACTN|nr:Sec-independent protein translocase subunit TatA [Actinocorallia herbida]ROO88425.1 sec-independent protein translocase protein TatA [Actinocorallia herbida]
MGSFGWGEILIIAVVILVLFGTKKMPDAARSLGRSLRIFKSETKGLMNDDEAKPAPAPQQAAAPAQEIPAPQADGTTISGVPVSPEQAKKA